jgi:hypothetical protein
VIRDLERFWIGADVDAVAFMCDLRRKTKDDFERGVCFDVEVGLWN